MNATMKNTASTEVARTIHPPISTEIVVARRVSLLDRTALHVGIALVKWGRRPLAVESRERRAHRAEQYLARLAREREIVRSRSLVLPPR